MLKKRIWIVLAVVLLIAVCAVWCFADGPWNWMQRLYFEDIRSAAAWAHVPEWEQRELADDELAKLLFLLSKLDRDDFTKNRQLAGGTPEFGLVIETETATYRINQSIAPDGEMEISRLGDDGLWWIDEDELADFVKSVLPERTISVPEQPKEPVQPQEKPAEKPEEPVAPEPDDDAQKKNAALKRLSNLRPEEIVEIEYPSADPAELAALIRKVAANPVERTEDKSMFEIWGLWVDMTTNADGAGREELLRLYASPEEENVVKLYYRSGTRENTTLCLEDSELYWFVRNRYSTKDVIDEAAIAPYYEILAARAQKTMDESANWHGAQPLSGYEILSFEQVDSFEKDGAEYTAYKWDVAFLTENPAKVGWAGGMWLDSQCRVRAMEECTYFVVCNLNGKTDCEFFWYDLYTYCQEGMTQRESAHWEITRVFGDRMGGPVIPEEPDESALVATALERMRNLQAEEIVEIDDRNADPAMVAAWIRNAAEHPFERAEKSMFAIWSLTVKLSVDTAGNGRGEEIWIGAGPEEQNILHVGYHSLDGTYTTFFLENVEFYWYIRNRYNRQDVMDGEAMMPYRYFLDAKAQERLDECISVYREPFRGYEIISFEQVDSFEKDGAAYTVYEWDVGFLTDTPTKVGWSGDMWLDSQCRVRAMEECAYFVVCNLNGKTDCEFFWYDLYMYCQEGMTQQETAHGEITRVFGERMALWNPADDACPLTEIPLSDAEYDAASRAVLIDLRTGWWNGNSAPLLTYESGAFECLHRESVDGKLLLYGYGGYYAWNAADECVLSWMSETIVTLDAATLQTVDIWWPGDGAAHEPAMMACFPESIAAAVVEHAMDHYASANIRLMERAMSNRLPVGVMQSVPETRSFTRLGFQMEVTGVLSARRMSMLAEGVVLHEYVELSCVPGAKIMILNADMSDPAYSRDKKAHPNWGLYYTGETEQTCITDETGTVPVTPDLEGVYNLEASLFVFETIIVQ